MTRIEEHIHHYIGKFGITDDAKIVKYYGSEESMVSITREVFDNPPIRTADDIDELRDKMRKIASIYQYISDKQNWSFQCLYIIDDACERLRNNLGSTIQTFQVFNVPAADAPEGEIEAVRRVINRYLGTFPVKGAPYSSDRYAKFRDSTTEEKKEVFAQIYRDAEAVIQSEDGIVELDEDLMCEVNKRRFDNHEYHQAMTEYIQDLTRQLRKKMYPASSFGEEQPAEITVEAEPFHTEPEAVPAQQPQPDPMTAKVHAFIQMRALLDEKKEEKKRKSTKLSARDDSELPELTQRQYQIVNMMRQNPMITSDRIGEQMGLHPKTIAKDITDLRNNGYITRVGGRKSGQWLITLYDKKNERANDKPDDNAPDPEDYFNDDEYNNQ